MRIRRVLQHFISEPGRKIAQIKLFQMNQPKKAFAVELCTLSHWLLPLFNYTWSAFCTSLQVLLAAWHKRNDKFAVRHAFESFFVNCSSPTPDIEPFFLIPSDLQIQKYCTFQVFQARLYLNIFCKKKKKYCDNDARTNEIGWVYNMMVGFTF